MRPPESFILKINAPLIPSDMVFCVPPPGTQNTIFITRITGSLNLKINYSLFRTRPRHPNSPLKDIPDTTIEQNYFLAYQSTTFHWQSLCHRIFQFVLDIVTDCKMPGLASMITKEPLYRHVRYLHRLRLNHYQSLYDNPNFFKTPPRISNNYPQYRFDFNNKASNEFVRQLYNNLKPQLDILFPIWLHIMKPYLHIPRIPLTCLSTAQKDPGSPLVPVYTI
jgi:hypothetical protein